MPAVPGFRLDLLSVQQNQSKSQDRDTEISGRWPITSEAKESNSTAQDLQKLETSSQFFFLLFSKTDGVKAPGNSDSSVASGNTGRGTSDEYSSGNTSRGTSDEYRSGGSGGSGSGNQSGGGLGGRSGYSDHEAGFLNIDKPSSLSFSF